MMTYDEERLVRLLTVIKDIAVLPYPVPTDAGSKAERVDPMLLFSLGQIAGTAMKALEDYKRRSTT